MIIILGLLVSFGNRNYYIWIVLIFYDIFFMNIRRLGIYKIVYCE